MKQVWSSALVEKSDFFRCSTHGLWSGVYFDDRKQVDFVRGKKAKK